MGDRPQPPRPYAVAVCVSPHVLLLTGWLPWIWGSLNIEAADERFPQTSFVWLQKLDRCSLLLSWTDSLCVAEAMRQPYHLQTLTPHKAATPQARQNHAVSSMPNEPGLCWAAQSLDLDLPISSLHGKDKRANSCSASRNL